VSTADRGSILVVDDDPDIREIMVIALESEGYCVATATDGAECMRQLRVGNGKRPCLILLDMMMDGMNGWDVCAELAKDSRLATIPVVILTGNNQITGEGLPVTGLLRKPIQLATLIDVVEKSCGPPTETSYQSLIPTKE
jgi:CheY-like chemotaxis protein